MAVEFTNILALVQENASVKIIRPINEWVNFYHIVTTSSRKLDGKIKKEAFKVFHHFQLIFISVNFEQARRDN